MTATTSSKSPSFIGKRFKNNFRGNKRNFVVHLIMSILGLPLIAVIAIIAIYNETQYYNLKAISVEVYDSIVAGCRAFAFVGVLCFIISLFLGITLALTNFKYLYKKSITDMNYALPLSGTQRFFADYLSGFTMYVAPIVGAILLAIAILGIGTPIVSGLDDFWENFDIVLKVIFIVLIAIIQFYTLSVLAIVFCGNTFESIFSIFAFNVLIPAAISCVWVALCQSYSYGIEQSAIFYNNIFTSTSPIGAVAFFFISANTFDYADSFGTFLYTKWIIITLIVTAIYLAFAYLLYRRRKAEDVSKPYVYKIAFYAIMTMATFCVLSLFISFGGFLAAGVVLCGIMWFIMEVITRRGFKKFWQAGLGFGAAVISVIVLCNLFGATKGFGMTKKVPSVSSVESIAIRETEITDYDGMVFRDKEVIEEAVKLHEELVDRHFNQEKYSYNTTNIEHGCGTVDDSIFLQYSTYTGSTISRSYAVPSNMSAELKKAILLSDDYAEQIYKEMFYFEIEYCDEYSDTVFTFFDKAGKHDSRKADIATFKALREAYKKDLMDMTEADLLNAKFRGKIDNQYFVLETFDNTISILEGLEIDCGDLTRADISDTIDIKKSPVFYSEAYNIFTNDYAEQEYYYYNDSHIYTVLDSISGLEVYYNGLLDYVTESNEAIDLINRSTPMVWGEMPLAVFEVNGEQLYLLDRGYNKMLLESLEISKQRVVSNDDDRKYKVDFHVGEYID